MAMYSKSTVLSSPRGRSQRLIHVPLCPYDMCVESCVCVERYYICACAGACSVGVEVYACACVSVEAARVSRRAGAKHG